MAQRKESKRLPYRNQFLDISRGRVCFQQLSFPSRARVAYVSHSVQHFHALHDSTMRSKIISFKGIRISRNFAMKHNITISYTWEYALSTCAYSQNRPSIARNRVSPKPGNCDTNRSNHTKDLCLEHNHFSVQFKKPRSWV
jgi:hypothetical protein